LIAEWGQAPSLWLSNGSSGPRFPATILEQRMPGSGTGTIEGGEQCYNAFIAGLNRVTDDDILIGDLKRIYELLRASQTPLEPEFAAALYANCPELYRLF
jgi:hypothetical protein